MIFEQLNRGPCLTYLIAERESGSAMLVDPVLDHADEYIELLARRGFDLTYVVDTHSHADHISGAAAMRDVTDCEYVAHRLAPAGCVTIRVDEGSQLHVDDLRIDCLATPGHTRDSISLIVGDRLLTGDALFLDDAGAGRDDLPGGDPASHWATLEKFLSLPEDLIVCPAHDYHGRQPSTLGRQKKTNPHLRPRSKDEFVQYLDDLKLGPAEWMKDVLKANYACARDPGAAWIPVDLPACEVKGTLATSANELQVASISPKELQISMVGDDPPVLLDVRDASELTGELGSLEAALNIPVTALHRRMGELEGLRDREIVTVCRSGGRASTAAQMLLQAGFERVRVLAGGMSEWRAQGLPVAP